MHDWGLDTDLDYYENRWDHQLCSLFGMQGGISWVMFPYSQLAFLSRDLDKVKWTAVVYSMKSAPRYCQTLQKRLKMPGSKTNQLKKMKADLGVTIENIYPMTTTLLWARTSSLKALFRNRKYQCRHKWKWNAFTHLSKCKTKPVVLSLMLPYADSYVLLSRKIPSVMDL